MIGVYAGLIAADMIQFFVFWNRPSKDQIGNAISPNFSIELESPITTLFSGYPVPTSGIGVKLDFGDESIEYGLCHNNEATRRAKVIVPNEKGQSQIGLKTGFSLSSPIKAVQILASSCSKATE